MTGRTNAENNVGLASSNTGRWTGTQYNAEPVTINVPNLSQYRASFLQQSSSTFRWCSMSSSNDITTNPKLTFDFENNRVTIWAVSLGQTTYELILFPA